MNRFRENNPFFTLMENESEYESIQAQVLANKKQQMNGLEVVGGE